MRAFWKTVNTMTIPLAGYAPWWVLLETTGSRSGLPRLTPLSNGPLADGTISLLAVYGDTAAFVRNVHANPTVRVKRRGRWHEGVAEIREPTPEAINALGIYARRVLLRIGTGAKILQITLANRSGEPDSPPPNTARQSQLATRPRSVRDTRRSKRSSG